ncbi:hypothetical protein QBC38DRAFT_73106 [Podospora fimiseda]|uniref:Uncharacterized protein n=1 Tax=Podospora fimiseda TaxID=252190 RepID=A0AAN6YNS7_9PEZI|nr:hypothetical protein QBC38DRAFT_73106 [Podospora fimiseda]
MSLSFQQRSGPGFNSRRERPHLFFLYSHFCLCHHFIYKSGVGVFYSLFQSFFFFFFFFCRTCLFGEKLSYGFITTFESNYSSRISEIPRNS